MHPERGAQLARQRERHQSKRPGRRQDRRRRVGRGEGAGRRLVHHDQRGIPPRPGQRRDGVGLRGLDLPTLRQPDQLPPQRSGRRDDRKPQTREMRRRLRGSSHRHAHDKGKNRTDAAFAGEGDLAAQQVHEIAADREPQPRAAKFPRGRRVDLRERLEQFSAVLRRNADARVLHGEPEPHRLCFAARCDRGHRGDRRAVVRRERHRDLHRAPLGELHRIVHQIHEHLAQPAAIGQNRRRHLIVDPVQQHDVFGRGRRRKQVERFLHTVARVASHGLKHELARLNARKIQNVAGQLDQRLSARADGLHVVALLRTERRVAQQVGEPHDAVQRRPHLMAHRREKLPLGPVARLRQIARLPQFVLLAPDVGHVVKHRDKTRQAPVPPLHRRDHAPHRINRAVLAVVEPIALPRLAGAHGGHEFRENLGRRLAHLKIPPLPADEFAPGVAHLPAQPPVRILNATVQIDHQERGVALLHCFGQVVNGFALFELAPQHQQRAKRHAEQHPQIKRPLKGRAPQPAVPVRHLDVDPHDVPAGRTGLRRRLLVDRRIPRHPHAEVVLQRPLGRGPAGADDLLQARRIRRLRVVVPRQRFVLRARFGRIAQVDHLARFRQRTENINKPHPRIHRLQIAQPPLHRRIDRALRIGARPGEPAQFGALKHHRAAARIVDQLARQPPLLAAETAPARHHAPEGDQAPDAGDFGFSQMMEHVEASSGNPAVRRRAIPKAPPGACPACGASVFR